jgi:hypothetical protein
LLDHWRGKRVSRSYVFTSCAPDRYEPRMDAVEDFKFIKQVPPAGRRRSAILDLIGEPKSGSFRQIGGYQYEPTTAPPPAVTRSRTINIDTRYPKPLLLSTNQVTTSASYPSSVGRAASRSIRSGSPTQLDPFPDPSPQSSSFVRPTPPVLSVDIRSVSMRSNSSQHVIVRYQRGRAPTLDLRRFSDIDLATATDGVGEGLSPELKPVELPSDDDHNEEPNRPTSMTTPRMSTSFSFIGMPTPLATRSRHTIGGTEDLPKRSRSTKSNATTIRKSSQTYPYTNRIDTLEVLHALAMEFPAMPVQPSSVGIADSLYTPETDTVYPDSETLSRSGSQRTVNSRTELVHRSSSVKRKRVPKVEDEAQNERVGETKPRIPKDIPNTGAGPEADEATSVRNLIKLPSTPRPKARRQVALGSGEPMPQNISRSQSVPAPSLSAHNIDDSYTELSAANDSANSQIGQNETSRPGLPRIKSVGSAPRRWTPTPAQNEYSRTSVVAEWYDTRADGDHLVYPTPPLSAVGSVLGGETV